MNCPYCTEVIPDDVQFCPKCGTQMGTPIPPPGSPRPTPLPPGFKPPTSGKAVGSFICGLFVFFFPASLAAVILGHLSLSEIRKSAGRLKGQGLATIGLVLGYIGIAAIPLILIIAAIAIPNLLRAKMAANEASAVGSLRTYNIAIVSYSSQCPQQGYPASVENLGPGAGDCAHAGLVTDALALPRSVKSGYVFIYQARGTDAEGHVTSYAISADPLAPGTSGVRHFYTDESGIIRVATDSGASSESPPLQ
jgi:type IV pilus assembly protein PilA